MEVKYLWAQQAMKNKRFEIRKVPGQKNFADIGTKPKSATEMRELMNDMGARLIRRSGDCQGWRRCRCDDGKAWADIEDIDDDIAAESGDIYPAGACS